MTGESSWPASARRFSAICILSVQIVTPAFAWDDKTFMDDGTPLRSGPGAKYRVIATIPEGQVLKGVSKSIDKDCGYEDKFDFYCHVTWKGKNGYVAVSDLLVLGDEGDW